jgi:hypothetical protein
MRRLALPVLAALLASAAPLAAPGAAPEAPEPLVVVAHVDVGINPYALDFRWDDPRAFAHPCTYIPAYPCDATALPITLDAPDFATALAADAALWASVQLRTLYWFPGTKVVGAISFNDHGDVPLLDEDGHGTMTASRSAGNSHSLCQDCLFVSVEGLGTQGVTWAAESGFVDVQTNSWGSSAFTVSPGIATPVLAASQRHLVLFASGNGLGGFDGYVSSSTYTMATGGPGAILVGAHDNGHLLAWPGSPPHVIADGFGGWTALRDSIAEVRPDPGACCTSAASPYAAGGAAAIALEARRILGDPGPGVRDGVVARGAPGLVAQGPLADGVFTLQEWKEVVLRTATLRPVEGPDDGLLHWLAAPAPDRVPPMPCDPLADPLVADQCALAWVETWGQNPFCPGCWSTPVRWSSVPGTASVWDREGYGAIDGPSVALAKEVLRGALAMPERPVEDALFQADQALRHAWFFRAPPP